VQSRPERSVGTFGKRKIRDILEETQNEIQEYYGLLNELRMGASSKVPQKPDILTLYENLNSSGLPLWSGGYMDQPYITSEMLQTTKTVVDMMNHIQDINDRLQKGN
jgi:hypothetical protein